MTTSQRLRAAKRALRQASTLLRDAATLGTMHHATRGLLLSLARDIEDSRVYAQGLEIQVNRDMDAVRRAKRRAA